MNIDSNALYMVKARERSEMTEILNSRCSVCVGSETELGWEFKQITRTKYLSIPKRYQLLWQRCSDDLRICGLNCYTPLTPNSTKREN